MTNGDVQIAVARAIATIAHRGQVDKIGAPYIGHPARVVERLEHAGENPISIAAGWLHDVLEDTDLTRDDLLAAGVDLSVVETVEAVTRRTGETPEEYYRRIFRRQLARPVKAADISDNLDPRRLALLDDATIARLTRKYAKARVLLGISPKLDTPGSPNPTVGSV